MQESVFGRRFLVPLVREGRKKASDLGVHDHKFGFDISTTETGSM